jgi:signal transduction histidine kinase
MKLASRFVAAIAVAGLAVMATHYYLQDRQDAALFQADYAHDMEVVRAFEAVIEALVERTPVGTARAIVEEANRLARESSFRFVALRTAAGEIEAPDLPPDARAAVMRREVITIMRPDDTGRTRRLTYLPIAVKAVVVGALELSESMATQEAHRWRRRVILLLTTILLLTVSGLAVMGIGFFTVLRPLRLLQQRARAVGAGDLGTRIALRRRDEIGQLAQEIDAMCDRVVEERLRVASETQEKIATLEQLRHTDRLTTMGQLASGVAHELGTPLNVIAARAKMIDSGDARSEEVGANARIIHEQAARMTAIIRQLLDFSRRQKPQLGTFNVREIASHTLAMLGPLAERSGVTLHLDPSEELLLARADRNQLQQALTNVIMNGIQAMPAGGRLAVRLGTRHGRPPGEPGGDEAEYVCVTVEDQGVGIPREYLGQVFEPFFTTKGVGEGTGLGLAVAYGIVREHGGWIEVESEVGKGSRFTIVLARAAGAGKEPAEVAS